MTKCKRCDGDLVFSARKRGDGLCGACARLIAGQVAPAAPVYRPDPDAACTVLAKTMEEWGARLAKLREATAKAQETARPERQATVARAVSLAYAVAIMEGAP